MRRLISAIALLAMLAGLGGAALATGAAHEATPMTGSPQPLAAPGFQLTLLAETGVQQSLSTPVIDPLVVPPGQRLYRAAIQPGNGFMMQDHETVTLTVEAGSLRLSTYDGVATVSVADGEPIDAEGGAVICAEGTCDLPAGQAVTLGPGNGFALAGGTLEADVSGDQPASLLVSFSYREGFTNLCWICPHVTP